MESAVLNYLKFELAASTPISFLSRFVRAADQGMIDEDSTLRHYTLYEPSNLVDCVNDLHRLFCANNVSTLPAVRQKYSLHKVFQFADKYREALSNGRLKRTMSSFYYSCYGYQPFLCREFNHSLNTRVVVIMSFALYFPKAHSLHLRVPGRVGCQPWTIALTRISIVGSSWLILHTVWVTALAGLAISAWWYTFLYSYPKSFQICLIRSTNWCRNLLEDIVLRKLKPHTAKQHAIYSLSIKLLNLAVPISRKEFSASFLSLASLRLDSGHLDCLEFRLVNLHLLQSSGKSGFSLP